MQIKTLLDKDQPFQISIHEGSDIAPVVLFAVGAGGQPERHATLLRVLVESGCTVVAPHFARFTSPIPQEEDLMLRARRLAITLDAFVLPGRTAVGVGHSIGAALLLALAGAQMWLGPGLRVNIAPDSRLTRIALLAAPTEFFQAPGALDAVWIPMLAFVGTEDRITPPVQTHWLAQAMCDRQPVSVRVVEGAGHFSFMDEVPPNTVEPLTTKQAFLQEHARDVCSFLLG